MSTVKIDGLRFCSFWYHRSGKHQVWGKSGLRIFHDFSENLQTQLSPNNPSRELSVFNSTQPQIVTGFPRTLLLRARNPDRKIQPGNCEDWRVSRHRTRRLSPSELDREQIMSPHFHSPRLYRTISDDPHARDTRSRGMEGMIAGSKPWSKWSNPGGHKVINLPFWLFGRFVYDLPYEVA